MVLKSSRILRVKGKVFSGSGEAAKFTELPWVKKQMVKKLGFISYPGTLNIRLTRRNIGLRKLLTRAKPIEILPAKGFCSGKCLKASLKDESKCAIVVPEIANYPEGIIEVVALINLREKFQLKDDDEVEVKIIVY